MAALLEVKDLVAGYGGVPVLDGVGLSVETGKVVAIIGPNGAGKSTLIRAIMGEVRNAAGSIRLGLEEIGDWPVEARARAGLALVPEGRRVFAGLTVRENLEVASTERAAARRAGLSAVFELFPVLAERAATRAWQLSGGQQQMLSLGRALMTAPRLILMDEPTLGLAPTTARDVAKAVTRIARAGTGILIAEQNEARLAGFDVDVMNLERGRIRAVERLELDPRS